jgi:hypothetical protein
MDIGWVSAAFAATLAGAAAGSAVDPIMWILAGAAGVTERLRAWRYAIAATFAVVKTGIIAFNSTLWREDPIIQGASWLDLVADFIGIFLAFAATILLVAVVTNFLRRNQRGATR